MSIHPHMQLIMCISKTRTLMKLLEKLMLLVIPSLQLTRQQRNQEEEDMAGSGNKQVQQFSGFLVDLQHQNQTDRSLIALLLHQTCRHCK